MSVGDAFSGGTLGTKLKHVLLSKKVENVEELENYFKKIST